MSKLSPAERKKVEDLLNKYERSRKEQLAAEYPDGESEINDRARNMAVGYLGIDVLLTELAEANAELAEAQKKRDAIYSQIQTKLPKRPATKYACSTPMELCEGLSIVSNTMIPKAKRRTTYGKLLLHLEQELSCRRNELALCATIEDLVLRKVLYGLSYETVKYDVEV